MSEPYDFSELKVGTNYVGFQTDLKLIDDLKSHEVIDDAEVKGPIEYIVAAETIYNPESGRFIYREHQFRRITICVTAWQYEGAKDK